MMDALRGLAVLLVLQAAGDGLAHALRLPVPGPLVGMMLLIVALRVECLRTPMRAISELLLAHLSLLFGLTATLAVYVVVQAAYERLGRAPWANPVLWSVVVIGAGLVVTRTPYPTYFSGAQFVQ